MSTEVNTVDTIHLGDIVTDDVGTLWQCVQETRHYLSSDIYRFVLLEVKLDGNVNANRPARLAMLKQDGSEFVCVNSPATCIVSVAKQP